MVKHAYQGLYDSSIAYGMKKALVAEQRRKDMDDKRTKLEKELKDLEAKCSEMEDYIERVTREEE